MPLLLIITFVGFVLVQATGDPLAAYTVDSSLSFLGRGVQPPTAIRGNMLFRAQR